MTQNDQNCISWAKFGRFRAKNPHFTGGRKSFGIQKMENHLGTLFALFLVEHGTKWAKNAKFWPKMPILGQIWPKMTILRQNWPVLGPKILIFFRRAQKFCYPHNAKTNYAPCSHCFVVRHGTKWAKNDNNFSFGPKISIFMR